MKKPILGTLVLACALASGCATTPAPTDTATEGRQIYEWRIYTLAPEADTARLDTFFEGSLIPAYNRRQVEVGAFTRATENTVERVLFFAYPDIETFQRVSGEVRGDADFLASAAGYFDATAPDPVYTDLETYLCEAFDSLPRLRRPDADRGLVELRVYRSPNAEANERKIDMFQSGEFAIFDAVGIAAVCYGRTLAGPRMPSVVYLTAYRDRASRDAAWDRFRTHPDWARMKALPQYANTATDNTSRLLAPLPYSQY